MMPKIVLSSWVHPEVIAFLAGAAEVVPHQERDALPADELGRRCRDAQGLMAFMSDRIDEGFLRACPDLKVIACALKGYDNFDVAACERQGVWLTIVPDRLTLPTAELAIGLMIGLARNILPGDRLVRSGRFRGWRPVLYGRGLDGSTVGLIGVGAVGKAVARRLAGFQTTLLYTDRVPLSPDQEDALRLHCVSRDELLRRSDFVLLGLPLAADTRGLVDARFLERLKRGACLINIARGSLVDETAVADALESGALGGYAADVFAFEDWAIEGRPAGLDERLRTAQDRTLFTPHLGSAVDDVRRDIALQAAASLLDALRGQVPAGAVNRPSAARGIVVP
ncbi:phosphonate dehydrogenase [Enhydrobacter sp.]|jgi:phosphonate dehydrogenase|uniref:phosphonate dehydrogenase n=1 Tax=Enhydrobacter sp. TaxID=1894999 RepID=UPI00262E9AEB|nr:phosphonate dehydrogenase [Enhydrobacter sp.]WIM11172.1 MAG: Phosphonate dehydrogenase [Enhydrobacter sp.]